jgi:two-component sensor histidine kinase
MRSLRGLLASIPQFATGSFSAYAFAGACILVATVVRLSIGASQVPATVPYATYYPAVLVATLAGGGRAGVFALVAGGVAADYLFMSPSGSWPYVNVAKAVSFILYALSTSVIILIALAYRDAMVQLKQADEGRVLLTRELQHRMKNTYAVIQAVIAQTLGHEDPHALTINRRISALLSSNDHLTKNERGQSVTEILDAEVSVHAPGRVIAQGETVMLSPEHTQIVALFIHELATNSLKYGALSIETGRAEVSWSVHSNILRLSWCERGVMAAREPERPGFGTKLLTEILARAGGSFSRTFCADEVLAIATVPLDEHRDN